jgi:uncharacterized membrane protein YkoI
MKRSFLLTLALSSLVACGQTKVPEATRAAFASKFPGAKSVKWDEEKEDNAKAVYEAEFKMNGQEYSANFNDKGEWLETEMEVEKDDIPSPVRQMLDKDFSGYKTGEMARLETPEMKGYEIILKKGKEKIEVTIDPNGKLLKKEELKSKKEPKEEDEEGEEGDKD